jgi:pyrroline-5-carboxylate reductase
MKHITIIGAGNMGSILVARAVEFFMNATITVCDTNPEKLQALKEEYTNIQTSVQVAEAVSAADLIILAIKPQQFEACGVSIREVNTSATVLSIMAGVSTESIATGTGLAAIVRTMPNTPMMYGKGVIGWYATESTAQDMVEAIISFLDTSGTTIACATEDDINKITAISGSGPAYFFQAVESLTAAAEALGFDHTTAQTLARETMLGAAALLSERPDAAALKQQVMSKGGTTEAAIHRMEQDGMTEIWIAAARDAYERAIALSTNA